MKESKKPTKAKKTQVVSNSKQGKKHSTKKKRNPHTLRGRDGKLLKKGEFVYGCKDRKKWKIEGFYKNNPWPVRVTEGIQLKPEWLTHTPEDEFAVQRMRGKRLSRAMDQAQMTPYVLSKRTGIPKRVLLGWMQFFWCENPAELLLLCVALDIDAAWLLGDREEDERRFAQSQARKKEVAELRLKEAAASE